MFSTNLLNTSVIDNQTGRRVFTSSLATMNLAGWQYFQDARYTTVSPLTLTEDVEARIMFDPTQLTQVRNERIPQIGSIPFPLWDFTDNKLISYKENLYAVYRIRLQFTARALTSSAGVGCEGMIRIPEDIDILRDTKSLLKGTDPQRMAYDLEFYVDQETVDSGLEFHLLPIGSDIEIYDVNMLIKSY